MLKVVKQDKKYTQVINCQLYRKCEQDLSLLAFLTRNKKEAFNTKLILKLNKCR